MKIAILIDMLKSRNLDDEILVPCGPDTITDRLQIREVQIGAELSCARRVVLLPLEGAWATNSIAKWERQKDV